MRKGIEAIAFIEEFAGYARGSGEGVASFTRFEDELDPIAVEAMNRVGIGVPQERERFQFEAAVDGVGI